MARVGLGGSCPHCDEAVTLAALFSGDVAVSPDFGGTFAEVQVVGHATRTCSPYTMPLSWEDAIS